MGFGGGGLGGLVYIFKPSSRSSRNPNPVKKQPFIIHGGVKSKDQLFTTPYWTQQIYSASTIFWMFLRMETERTIEEDSAPAATLPQMRRGSLRSKTRYLPRP